MNFGEVTFCINSSKNTITIDAKDVIELHAANGYTEFTVREIIDDCAMRTSVYKVPTDIVTILQ